MTAVRRAVWRDAACLLHLAWVLQQMALAVIVFVLSIVWLRLPDSNVLWVAVSLLLGLLILCVALGGETALLLRLARRTLTRARLLRGALLLLLAVLLWYIVGNAIDHLQAHDALRAGYYNSRFSASRRQLFTYEHLMTWLGWLWTAIRWIVLSLLGALFIAPVTAAQIRSAIARTAGSPTYWIATALLCFGGSAITAALVNWMPGHGLRVEMVSVALRLLCAFFIDGVLVCFVFAVIAECTRRSDLGYKAPDGTPVVSQPRTAEIP
ncbi:MAG TPA: hypothetical protein VFA99_08175 [Acidobacteriaceae bacterium]|nr:hypothetical protein [Acidobacteriaceae bacterium]